MQDPLNSCASTPCLTTLQETANQKIFCTFQAMVLSFIMVSSGVMPQWESVSLDDFVLQGTKFLSACVRRQLSREKLVLLLAWFYPVLCYPERGDPVTDGIQDECGIIQGQVFPIVILLGVKNRKQSKLYPVIYPLICVVGDWVLWLWNLEKTPESVMFDITMCKEMRVEEECEISNAMGTSRHWK